jgi:protein TonB
MTASLPSASSGSSAASRASWQSQLVAYLQRNLRYPPGSRGGGSASISFSLNRQGRVTSASLARSAGSSELDQAALALFHGSLPPPPADVPGNSFSFTIPIRFNLR